MLNPLRTFFILFTLRGKKCQQKIFHGAEICNDKFKNNQVVNFPKEIDLGIDSTGRMLKV